MPFLFKRDEYKNEKEVRLVIKGVEFEKKFCKKNKEDKSVNPPRVYIELEPIKKRVEQITLGPKVDKANEWASAFTLQLQRGREGTGNYDFAPALQIIYISLVRFPQ